jgi:hypothetical protein
LEGCDLYGSISLIGLGSLGSFLARTLVDASRHLKELILIDYDVVSEDNLERSLYDINDIGKLKIDALFDKIRNYKPSLSVQKLATRLISGSPLPICDLHIDCRDFHYNSIENVPMIRTYISSGKLVVDCRDNIKHQRNIEGSYSTVVLKHHLLYASTIIANLIDTGNIKKLIDKKLVQIFELDYLEKKIEDKLNRVENMPDVIYDSEFDSQKLLNLLEYSQPIISSNKNSPITVYVGGRNRPTVKETIPPNRLCDFSDLISCLSPLTQLRFSSNYYIVIFSPITPHGPIIELIPDDGSA